MEKELILRGESSSRENNPKHNRIEYSLKRREHLPYEMGYVVATVLDNHYILWERWESDKVKRAPESFLPKNIIGVAHSPEKANKRMYSRMYKRALRIARRERRKIVRDININLERLAELKAFSSSD